MYSKIIITFQFKETSKLTFDNFPLVFENIFLLVRHILGEKQKNKTMSKQIDVTVASLTTVNLHETFFFNIFIYFSFLCSKIENTHLHYYALISIIVLFRSRFKN